MLERHKRGVVCNDLRDEIDPLLCFRDNESIPGRTLKRRHVLNAADSAILPSGIPVPVRENNRQTGNQNKSQGRSAKGAPMLAHSVTIIVPAKTIRKLRPCGLLLLSGEQQNPGVGWNAADLRTGRQFMRMHGEAQGDSFAEMTEWRGYELFFSRR